MLLGFLSGFRKRQLWTCFYFSKFFFWEIFNFSNCLVFFFSNTKWNKTFVLGLRYWIWIKNSKYYRVISDSWFIYFNSFNLHFRKKLFNMITATKKWIFIKLSAVVMLPLMIWFVFQLVSIYNMGFEDINSFFVKQPNKFLFSLFVIITYFYSALSISEVFEDYIVNEKLKNVANKILYLFAIIMPIFTIFILYKLSLWAVTK